MKLSVREKAARRDGAIGKLATPGVFYEVTHWSWEDETAVARIPLRARDGSVRAWALVDPGDAVGIGAHKWHLAHGYACRTVYLGGGASAPRYRTVHMHREILELGPGTGQVDHVNRDRLDNRRANLRVVSSHAENCQNVPGRGGTSKYRGVARVKSGKWRASVGLNRERHYLGEFVTEEEANAVAVAFRRQYMPFSTA